MHTLGKLERLKSRKIIEQLFKEGSSFAISPFRLYHIKIEGTGPPVQAGFGASTKNMKRAVDRNRTKRLMKEAYRLQNQELQKEILQKNSRLAVFFIYTGKEVPGHALVTEKIGVILQRLVKSVHEINRSPA